MLFYPDQYFYNNFQKPRSRNTERPSRGQAPPSFGHDECNPWNDFFFGGNAPFAQPQRRGSYVPDEYLVVDDDELAALRAYRESRRQQSQQSERREAIIARRRAEHERKVREAARKQNEARMRAEVEANARAAAREYIRRKQAQQIALQQAQQEERQRRQQFILEQLRNQFGMFGITKPSSSEEAVPEQEENNTHEHESPEIVDAHEEPKPETSTEESPRADSQEEAYDQASNKEETFDPIRSLIEALSPFPFIIAADSSDEEDNRNEPERYGDAPESEGASSRIPKDSEDADHAGATCETASESESEPAFVEFLDPFARPPVFADSVISPNEDDDEEDDDFEDDEAESKKDRSKQRQSKVPSDRHIKKQKHNEKKKSKKSSSDASSSSKTTSTETVGLMHALEEELTRLNEGYQRLSNMPTPDNLKEAVSRVEGIRIGCRRSEEIYNKLDQIRTGKDQRKLKHQITTNAVALADKFDELLQSANAVRRALSGSERPESPKHQVTMEEVEDESE